MIWLNHNGPVQPFGSQAAAGTSIGGRGYNVWFGTQGWNTVSYTMTTPATSVSGLDLAPLVQDAISRGYIQPSWCPSELGNYMIADTGTNNAPARITCS